ncbi:hypothetical protein NDU88_012146 [Pleurodeles waltl]|uniref:Uncharacterized protein n=1 Tax=Pleurodeles waltl TaxID=8319 RepID=A0AAV7R544_PLEWA|nr:hypothetical protein NDU88_012146 [Pleurodeles waltl]
MRLKGAQIQKIVGAGSKCTKGEGIRGENRELGMKEKSIVGESEKMATELQTVARREGGGDRCSKGHGIEEEEQRRSRKHCNEVLDYSVANREKPYFILGRYA